MTPAASFRRGDTVWLVFDSAAPLDVEPIRAKGGAIIGDVSRMPLDNGQAVRIRLNRPQMPSLSTDERTSGTDWTMIFADKVQAPPQPLVGGAQHRRSRACQCRSAAFQSGPACTGWSIPTPAIRYWSSPRRRRSAASSSGRTSSTSRCSIPPMALRSARTPTTSQSRSPADKIIIGKPGGLTLSSADVISRTRADGGASAV